MSTFMVNREFSGSNSSKACSSNEGCSGSIINSCNSGNGSSTNDSSCSSSCSNCKEVHPSRYPPWDLILEK